MIFLSTDRLDTLQSIEHQADGVELRLDLFANLNLEFIENYLIESKNPALLTLRKESHGGKFSGCEADREAWIEKLLKLHPAYFDLEWDMREDFLHNILHRYRDIRFILSYHNFKETPENLDEIYEKMSQFPATFYKMAVMCKSACDALRTLLFAKKRPRLVPICMGESGEFGRVLSRIMKSPIQFACSNGNPLAPGQISISDLTEIYRYRSLNRETKLYGLIGNPVLNSRGHIHHNRVFQDKNRNAVYVKMCVKPEELKQFFPLAIEMGFQGMSVTAPLKEKVLPFLDSIDPAAEKIGAVNTLLFEGGKVFGTNTDGIGALDAIEKHEIVLGKRVVLLGAGGAAKAIAFETKKRGAQVLVLNRTLERAQEVARLVGCNAGLLDEVPDQYDILINCTPEMPIDPAKIKSNALVMDIVYSPRETLFLKEALKIGCRVVYGEEMFLNQAALQTALWMKSHV